MNPEQLYQQAKTRFDHAQARRILKEKYEAKLMFAHAGGMWRANPELVVLLKACDSETAVIADLYENPVQIVVHEMLAIVQQRWQEQMNAWLAEFNEINQQR